MVYLKVGYLWKSSNSWFITDGMRWWSTNVNFTKRWKHLLPWVMSYLVYWMNADLLKLTISVNLHERRNIPTTYQLLKNYGDRARKTDGEGGVSLCMQVFWSADIPVLCINKDLYLGEGGGGGGRGGQAVWQFLVDRGTQVIFCAFIQCL